MSDEIVQATAAAATIIAQKTQESVLLLGKDISYIKNDISEIKMLIDNKYVTKEEFKPIKMLVYGMVGLMLSSVVVALIALVVKAHS